MPKKTHNELKAGIFVIVAVAIVLGIVIWLGASDIFQRTYTKAVFYSDIETGPKGIKVDYAVKVGDIEIGKITSVRHDPDSGRIIYEAVFTEPGYEMHTDGEARVSTSNLLGQPNLVIASFGSKQSPPADAEHPVQITGGLDETIENFNRITQTMLDELDDENSQSLMHEIKGLAGRLNEVAEYVNTITQNIAPETDVEDPDSILANLKETMKYLAATSKRIDDYTQKDLEDIIVNVRKISTSVLQTARNLEVSTDRIKQILVVNQDGIDEMMGNMVLVSANLRAASTEIRRNPWRLFYRPDEQKLRSDNIYDAARSFDRGAAQLREAVARLKAIQQLDTEDPDTAEKVKNIKAHLMESFQEFKKVEEALWKEVE